MTTDAVERYERACVMAAMVRAEWERQGSPLLCEGGSTGKAMVPHPLWSMVQMAERDAERFGKTAAIKHRGPEPSAVVEADVSSSPAARVRQAA